MQAMVNVLSRLVWIAMAVIGCLVLIYTPLLSWRLLSGQASLTSWVIGLCSGAIAITLIWGLRGRLIHLADALQASVLAISARRWLVCTLLVGLALRIVWAIIFPTPPLSDDISYVQLAQQLAAGKPYVIDGTWAYWPPGYPLLLAGLMRIFGQPSHFFLALNLLLFLLAAGAIFQLGRTLATEAAARLAVLFLALWPGYMSAAGLPGKEAVLVAVLPMVVLLYLPQRGGHRLYAAIGAGLLLGACTLVQPSLMLFPAALLGIDLLSGSAPRAIALRLAVVTTAAVLTVLPWSVRNYAVFHQVVPISTNGGDNFYRANNALATGGYTKRGTVDLSSLSELEADRQGKALAKNWIEENPAAFARLMVEKHILFLGDDAGGIYATLRRGNPSFPAQIYGIAKAGANLFWMGMWLLIITVAWRGLRGGMPGRPAIVALPFLYFFALHSLFESNGKYHAPAWAFIALAAALAIAPARKSP